MTEDERGPFSPEEQSRLRDSLFRLLPLAEAIGEAFYRRLFEARPDLRALFPDDMSEQQDKFMQMMATMVNTVDRPEALAYACRQLGARHRAYGAEPDHYETVEMALLSALEMDTQGLIGPSDLELWRRMYRSMAESMRQPAA